MRGGGSSGSANDTGAVAPAATTTVRNGSPPLKLDRAGAIAVGCNIHDQMIAYLYVTAAPWFVQTGASGKALFDALPAGDYEVVVWQPRLRPGRAEPARRITIAAGATATVAVPLRLLPDPRLQDGREHVHY
jgi:hypothetical protein